MGCSPSNASKVSNKNEKNGAYVSDVGPPYDPNAAADSDNGNENGNEAPVRNYFSFSSFILQSEEAVLFDWHFSDEIGKGAMSRVFLAEHIVNHLKCAAKVYNKGIISRPTLGLEEPPYVAVKREIQIQTNIEYRYVLPIIEVIDDECSNSLIILMPFAEYGTLQSYITNYQVTEDTLAVCFYEVAKALQYIHSQDVVHRDLKPENILVFSSTIFVISDFSASSKLESSDEKLLDTKGSPAFLSPEECGGESFYPKPADVWAYGVTIFSCLFHKLPFNLDEGQGKTVASTVYSVSQLLETEELEIPSDPQVSKDAISLLESILVKDPNERPTFEEILKCPWFKDAIPIDEENEVNSDNASEDNE